MTKHFQDDCDLWLDVEKPHDSMLTREILREITEVSPSIPQFMANGLGITVKELLEIVARRDLTVIRACEAFVMGLPVCRGREL